MLSNIEVQKTKDKAGLKNLNRHLQSMDKMLQKANEDNGNLTEQINKLKDILGSNQMVFDNLQINQQSLGKILKDDCKNEEKYSKLIQRLAIIENKLFVTGSLFNDYKCRLKDNSNMLDNDVVLKLSNQINVLGTNLLSVGNQLKLMSQDKMKKEHDASNLLHWSCNSSNQTNICWTQCKTQMKDMLQMGQLTMVQSHEKSCSFDSDIEETPIRQIRYQKKIIQRVQSILARAEHLNIRSETLSNVKVLAKMILSALVKRNHLHLFCCTENTMSNKKFSPLRTIPNNLSYNPYLQ